MALMEKRVCDRCKTVCTGKWSEVFSNDRTGGCMVSGFGYDLCPACEHVWIGDPSDMDKEGFARVEKGE